MKCARSGCKNWPIKGATVCRVHGGSAPQVRAHAAVRAEVMRWTVGDATDDPAETLLRLITQSRARADLYAGLLQDAYDAAERIARADAAGDSSLTADARRDLDLVLSQGGVSALIGRTYGAAGKDGDIYSTGEAVRGLAALEAAERDRCAGFCAKAITAGLADRMVRVAERQAETVAEAVRAAVVEAGLSEDVRASVLASVGRHLRALPA